jgi:hypothetical protein
MKPMLMVVLLVTPLFAFQGSPEVATVLQRATEYVTQYEEQLGNLIGAEEYVQNAVWMNSGGRGYAQVGKKTQKRTSSDFLIIQVGSEWTALRKFNRVDGFKEKEVEPAFEDVFDNSPQANAKRLSDMKAESTRHNLGDIRRDINLPTFALKVLRKSEVGRFSFERAGASRIEGIQTWAIRFQEQSGRSLVVGGKGEILYSSGTLWIEPETGRILKTEFNVENRYTPTPLKGSSIVTYGEGKRVQMLVPLLMVERYETEFHTVQTRADYSNFRPFEVDVKFEIAPPQQQ